MKIAVLTVSRKGLEVVSMLKSELPVAAVYLPSRLLDEGDAVCEVGGSCKVKAFYPLEDGFKSAVGEIFNNFDALIFISAVAVAVRGVAPFLSGKESDPAVAVVDEGRKFAVSLLSGHLGGANELTGRIAQLLGATAVITTATDGRGLPAFDDLSRRWNWELENLPSLKKISAALLEGREIVLYSEKPFTVPLKGNIYRTCSKTDLRRAKNGLVIIGSRREELSIDKGVPWIARRPRNIAAGIGCRRGVAAKDIVELVRGAFQKAGRVEASLSCLASGEIKKDEKGLIEAARILGVPFRIYSNREIEAAIGDSETSDFVRAQVGVGAVAEPCAVLGSGNGEIILPVRKGNGLTIALAEGDYLAAAGG